MKDIIRHALDNKQGLSLRSEAGVNNLIERLVRFPLDWTKVKSIVIVAADLLEESYKLSIRFEEPNVVGSTRIIRLNDFEMRIE